MRMNRLIALFMCVLMLCSLTINVLAETGNPTDKDQTVCSECGAEVDHNEECSLYTPADPTEETAENTEATETTATTETTEATEATEAAEAPETAETAAHQKTETAQSMVDDTHQEGDKVWIKSGSYVYKSTSGNHGYEILLPHQITIEAVITNENGEAQWYEFSEWSLNIHGYKYVRVDDTSTEKPTDPGDPENPNNPEKPEKEITVGNISLKVQGVPDDVTLGAETVAPKSWHEDLFDVVGSKKVVFAIDITLTGEDGLWQPADNESVTVSLDAASLGLSEGERIGILHDHDGSLTDLGICTVTDGKLTFETNSFSVFYGYTVDFEYDGTWHSMSGGGYMYLSELFEILNIDRSVNSVASVSFSDAELLALTHMTYIKEEGGGQDWRLVSLAPFDTEEILTVAFNDGEVLEINVYDIAWGSDNIDSNEIWNNKDTQGDRKVTKNSTITINPGATVTLNGTITIPEGTTLSIICSGNATLKRGSKNNRDVPLFQVNGGKLIIKSTSGTITVDGSKIAVARAAFVVGITKNGSDNGGSTLELTNVTIKNCYSDGDGYGGAINFIGGNSDYRPLHLLKMTNCVVENCRAPHGSAIYFRGNSMGRATVKNTVFKNCVTYGKTELDGDDQGGTIRSNGQNGSIVIFEQCIFQNNRSGYSDLNTVKPNARCYGGAIYWNSAGATSTSSDHNDLIDKTNTRAKMYIYDCQIVDNKTSNRGGGIFNEAAMYIGTRYEDDKDDFTTSLVSNTYEIKGTLIDGNVASGYTGDGSDGNCGGGVMVPSYGGGASESRDMDVSLNIGKGVYITNNSSRHGGGFAMQINETEDKNSGVTFSVDYDGAVIEDNTATDNGGGVYITMQTSRYNSELNLVSGTIAKNKARNGGGVYVENTNINIGASATTTDNAIKIEGNQASENGGGIYLKQETAYVSSVQINVSNGFVTGNTATKNGGGIYQTGTIGNCLVTGEGEISNNTAANGGGIYIAGGSTLSVTGGIIINNRAVGSSNAATAKEATCGVGGGIYVHTGEFSMSGDHVGLHSNDASVAANDAYATGGTATMLTLPDVENMDLAGWTGTGKPEGWFADYKADDPNYPSGIIKVDSENTTNPGRYNYYDEDKVEVDYVTVLSTNANTYYCLTIGTPHPGYGNLWILKTLTAPAKEDQTFIFEVTGTTRKPVTDYFLTVTLVIEKGETFAQVLVANIPDGTYTVTEKEAWSWRYDQKTRTFQPKDGAVIGETTFTVAIENPEWIAVFTNARERIYWLSGDSHQKNVFDGIDTVTSNYSNALPAKKDDED